MPVPPPPIFEHPLSTVGNLSATVAARLTAASCDVALVLDRDGVIRDVSVAESENSNDCFADLVGRRWTDTVTTESRRKIEDSISEAGDQRPPRWREICQLSAQGPVPLRYRVIETGNDGRMLALGRDLRNDQALQQRVLQAQQAMERDYVKLRQTESRYRLLFQIASEAFLLVNPATRKVVEANPAAGDLLGVDSAALVGQPFAKLFNAETRDAALSLISDPGSATRGEPVSLRLANGRDDCLATASQFRQEGALLAMVSLSTVHAERRGSDDDVKLKMLRVLNRVPDAFVVTDEDMTILDVNLAFIELAQVPSTEAARGMRLADFLARPGIDLKVLLQTLRDHGWVRNFETALLGFHGEQEEVELSAVSVPSGLETCFGFVIRPAKQTMQAIPAQADQLPRTAEELTKLVGRLSLREIVSETTDVIERMCIKAALTLTDNNRASAAEILGLSRQSLYSKLSRHGL
ncbi:MAG TPA: transcriptional regulator PpsR [Rhodospirillaceae bacterium]|nr:transcriptional regulator PpsR [Rhodospirillaceae bacterium]